jgi:hypothetical protein
MHSLHAAECVVSACVDVHIYVSFIAITVRELIVGLCTGNFLMCRASGGAPWLAAEGSVLGWLCPRTKPQNSRSPCLSACLLPYNLMALPCDTDVNLMAVWMTCMFWCVCTMYLHGVHACACAEPCYEPLSLVHALFQLAYGIDGLPRCHL